MPPSKNQKLLRRESLLTIQSQEALDKLIKKRQSLLENSTAQSSRLGKTNMDLVRQILSLEPKARSYDQVKKTQLLFKDNAFFADMKK